MRTLLIWMQGLRAQLISCAAKEKCQYKLLTLKLTPRYSCAAAELEAALACGAALGLLLVVQS